MVNVAHRAVHCHQSCCNSVYITISFDPSVVVCITY